jgi:NitT/TauT family transport system substrate-binding protein
MKSQVTFRLISVALLAIGSIFSFFDESFAKEKVRMGYLQSDLHQLAAFVALEKGLYQKEGIDVVVGGIFKAGPEEMSAFASKDLDFGYVGEAPATVAVANKVADVKIIAQANLEGSALVIFKDSGIKSLKDLVGKTVAVPGYATVQDFLLRKALSNSHIPIKAVNVIIIKAPEMIPALRTKQIDAFVAWEPYPSKAVTLRFGEVLIPSGKIWPKHPCCVVIANTKFIGKNPEIVRGILKAHVKATNFIHENPKEALEIGVKYTGMDPETVKLAMKNITYEYVPDVQGLLDYVTFLQELGQIKEVDPKDFVQDIIQKDFKDFLEKISQQK